MLVAVFIVSCNMCEISGGDFGRVMTWIRDYFVLYFGKSHLLHQICICIFYLKYYLIVNVSNESQLNQNYINIPRLGVQQYNSREQHSHHLEIIKSKYSSIPIIFNYYLPLILHSYRV